MTEPYRVLSRRHISGPFDIVVTDTESGEKIKFNAHTIEVITHTRNVRDKLSTYTTGFFKQSVGQTITMEVKSDD